MSKKQDAYYFENFCACADCACQAAHLLHAWLQDFDPEHIHEKLDEMHAVEHAADEKKHEMLNVLARAFITPIEREDILLLSQELDDVTDAIEDVLLRLYMTCREEAVELMTWREIYDRMEKCCDACEHVANAVEGVIMKNS